MPELPEVETVVRHLRPQLVGKIITAFHLPRTYKKALHNCSIRKLNSAVAGEAVLSVSRRAKFIVLEVESGLICIHLRMTGRIMLSRPRPEEMKYVTAWFDCADGTTVYFKDVRKFGRIYFYEDPVEFHSRLGIEPFSKEFSSSRCHSLLHASNRALKPFLLDQTKIAGIGNIYADEILWACKLHPNQKCNSLLPTDSKNICFYTRSILRKSITLNGTTFQSFYYGDDASGEFHDVLKVFGKEGTPCPRCGTEIIKLRVAQRGTHLCPHCQVAADVSTL